MDPRTRAKIRACSGVYRVTDTARHFGVTRVTVRKIWAEPETIKDIEPPNIWDTRITPDLVLADTQILLDRGLTLDEVAKTLGCSVPMIRTSHAEAGITLRLAEESGADHQRALREDPGPVIESRGGGVSTYPGGEDAA